MNKLLKLVVSQGFSFLYFHRTNSNKSSNRNIHKEKIDSNIRSIASKLVRMQIKRHPYSHLSAKTLIWSVFEYNSYLRKCEKSKMWKIEKARNLLSIHRYEVSFFFSLIVVAGILLSKHPCDGTSMALVGTKEKNIKKFNLRSSQDEWGKRK